MNGVGAAQRAVDASLELGMVDSPRDLASRVALRQGEPVLAPRPSGPAFPRPGGQAWGLSIPFSWRLKDAYSVASGGKSNGDPSTRPVGPD